jgi:hypothetical protein
MTLALLILVGAGFATVGFFGGVRYCATKMLPGIFARMTPRELSQLAAQSKRLRDAEGD